LDCLWTTLDVRRLRPTLLSPRLRQVSQGTYIIRLFIFSLMRECDMELSESLTIGAGVVQPQIQLRATSRRKPFLNDVYRLPGICNTLFRKENVEKQQFSPDATFHRLTHKRRAGSHILREVRLSMEKAEDSQSILTACRSSKRKMCDLLLPWKLALVRS
jgi:hypothetical protein